MVSDANECSSCGAWIVDGRCPQCDRIEQLEADVAGWEARAANLVREVFDETAAISRVQDELTAEEIMHAQERERTNALVSAVKRMRANYDSNRLPLGPYADVSSALDAIAYARAAREAALAQSKTQMKE